MSVAKLGWTTASKENAKEIDDKGFLTDKSNLIKIGMGAREKAVGERNGLRDKI